MHRARIRARGDELAFEERVSELFEEARARLPADRVREGWLATPVEEWETVERWPGEDEGDDGPAYRRSARAPDPVVATRPPPSGGRTMLDWLASSPSRPFGEMVREARLTSKHLYVRRRCGRIDRMRREALRARRGGGDAVYVFGRRTELVLNGRASCPVCQALDAQLGREA